MAVFAPEFFDLNLRFPRRIAQVGGLPLGQALLAYTHLYLAFGLPHPPSQPPDFTFQPEAFQEWCFSFTLDQSLTAFRGGVLSASYFQASIRESSSHFRE